jgi:hypothetical protein
MWSPTLSKLSILSVLWRISSVQQFRLGVYIVSGMLLIYTITFTGLLSGPCNPKNVGGGTCLNNLAISQVVLNIATDLSIIILPIPTLYKLQMPFRKKVVAGAIMSLGSAYVFLTKYPRVSSNMLILISVQGPTRLRRSSPIRQNHGHRPKLFSKASRGWRLVTGRAQPWYLVQQLDAHEALPPGLLTQAPHHIGALVRQRVQHPWPRHLDGALVAKEP